MIKTRNLLILAVIVVVLLGVSLLQKARHRQATGRSATETVIAGEYTADGLGRITLGRGDEAEAVRLEHEADGWIVASAWGADANPDRIDALLRNLSGLRGEYRSDSADVLADYGLGADAAVHIRACDRGGQEVVALEVGRKAERQPGNFVRLPDQDTVYLSDKGLLSLLGIYGEPETPRSRFYVDLQAVKEDRLAVERLVIRDGDQVLDLRKEFLAPEPAADDTAAAAGPDRATWEWRLDGDPDADLAKSKVDAVFNSLISVRANDIDDPTVDLAAYGLAEPSRTARLVKEDGSEVVLAFGDQREADGDRQAGTWMQVAGDPTVWVVTEYTVKNIFKPRAELLAD